MPKLLTDLGIWDEEEHESEEDYVDPSVYATPSAYESLMREEHIGPALEMGETYDGTIGDIAQLDPMEILMLLEERTR